MAGEWQDTSLGEICSFAAGSAFSKGAQGDSVGKFPFIKVSDMNLAGNERFITIANNWVSEDTQVRLRAKVHPPGATVFAKIGVALTYNRRRLLCQPTLIDNNMMSAIPRDGVVDPLFFYYLLCTIDFNEVVVGTALPYLNISDLSRISVSLPPLREQRAIAHILGSLDDKIELNRKMNETLEAMARAIFKSWFVDFDPVRAKADGRDTGLPKEIADLFPDSLEDSELGEIPKGWRVGTLGDLMEHVVDRVQPSAFTESHPYVPIECIEARSVCLMNWQPGSNARSSLVRFRKGDIIFGAMRPYFHKVCIAPFDGTTRTTAFVLRPVASERAYTAFVVSRDETIDYATAHSEGSTIPYAKWAGSLEGMRLIVPPQNVRQAFHKSVWPFIERMMASVSANSILAALRDALLPKLISGQIRMKDAERIVGRCV